jgi:3-carboxy-cis,cis-muconate cycloisomerase
MAEAAEALIVNPARMRENIDDTHGTVFAEKATMLLAATLGRDAAHEIIKAAARRSETEDRMLAEVLAEMPEVVKAIDRKVLRDLDVPEKYLGSAKEFRKRLLAGPNSKPSKKK